MVSRKWTLLLILILVAVIFRAISGPIAPDIGTPGFLTPPQPGPLEMPVTAVPEQGLFEQQLQVPVRWRTSDLEGRRLSLPPGFKISVYASNLRGARFMAFDDSGNLFLSQTKQGKISVLLDNDGDGVAEQTTVFTDGLDQPHGLAFDGEWLYVAENDRVERFRDVNGDLRADERELVIGGLPKGGGHFTRTIGFGPDGRMYVSVGSSCNVCEDDPRRAAILRFNMDGSNEETFASGLRNSVGFVWHPATDEMYATDNGRDLLGDDLPPDEINIVMEGGHYGWPYCYGQRIPDPKFDDAPFCQGTEPPAVELQAHSAPLGLRFYEGTLFPANFSGALFVAYHGSWNRREPTGYKIVSVRFEDGNPVVEDFITGWLRDGEKWGRPVDVIFGGDGSMLISDDFGGVVYKVVYSR